MEPMSRAAGGLTNYIRAVADRLGSDVYEVDIDVEAGLATVIILVHPRIPTLVEQPVLLTWDEVNGWALRVEVDGDGDTTVLGYLGSDILPAPEGVGGFLEAAIAGNHPGTMLPPGFRQPDNDDELAHRLARFGT